MINIFIAGDSTVSTYDYSVAPRTGWGQVLGNYMNEKVLVQNRAVSGRSSKSFIDEGRLNQILNKIQANDYLFIQFGHNDEKSDKERHTEPFTSFHNYLTEYIEQARNKQAFPILLTPVQRRSFDDNGVFIETHGDYPIAMKQLAQQYDVPLIDLTTSSRILYEKLGPEASKEIFLWFKQEENINFPDGLQDDTHFSEYGANEIAQLVIEGIHEIKSPLITYLKDI